VIDLYPATPALIPLGVKVLLLTGALERLLEAVLAAALEETGTADVAGAIGTDAVVLEAGGEDAT